MGKKVHKELKKITKSDKKEPSKIGIYIQLILSVAVIILGLIYFVTKEHLDYLQLSLALAMFITAYNNQTVYKRKLFTIIYLAVGIVLLWLVIKGWLGV